MVISYVLKGYPRLSETFIAQEILALENMGLQIQIVSLRHPTEAVTHPIHSEIRASVKYLPEYLYQEPGRVLQAWRRARGLPGYKAALRRWLADLRRDPSANRIRRFGQALVMAAELTETAQHLHAHFLHTPASVTRYCSLMVQRPWSCSAHAKDVWTTPKWELSEKLRECTWAVTCTAENLRYLQNLAADSKRIGLAYHGIDLERFRPPPEPRSAKNGRDHADPVIILTVGRAVEKKGYKDLLDAAAALPTELAWRLEHIGGGPLLDRLKAQAENLGISDRVRWRGAVAHDEVLSAYRMADLFVLPCRIADDGDRDGLPNVLMEAQSQKLPCISTRISGIPELIQHEVTGLLVEQQDAVALSTALYRLATDPELRSNFGNAGYRRIQEEFSFSAQIGALARRFELPETAGAF